jgi:aryl-alcohol dehydrogenase-like predicted oxidoreductase
MKYNNIPSTNVKVSQISIGTMMFGGKTNEADSLAIMDCAYDHDINFFDTADVYNDGKSEEIVGKWMKNKRDKVIVASKIYYPLDSAPEVVGLSRRNIMTGIEKSLKRLDTDFIDIYYMHQFDYETSLDETMSAMDDLVRSGKIRYIGVSNFASWQISDTLAVCDKRNYSAPIISENGYNLLGRTIEPELVSCLLAHKIGLTVYNPIAGGFLSGKHKAGEPAKGTRFYQNKMYLDRFWNDASFQAVNTLTKLAKDSGLTLVQLAMKWVAAQPAVTSIISGIRTIEQMKENAVSLDGSPLRKEVLAACDEVWDMLINKREKYNR